MTASDMFWIGAALGTGLGCLGAWAAYRNGVTDGFGFAQEPSNPGYRKAGDYLRKHMAYRWPELGNAEYQPPTQGEKP